MAFLALLLLPCLTLSPLPPEPGETVRFVVAGDVRLAPIRAAISLGRREPGDTLTVREAIVVARRLWIETDRGFVEAARLDRIPKPVEGTLDPGEEGLAAGRVLPDAYRPHDLVAVPDSLKAADYLYRRMRLRAEALSAFERMIAAAAEDSCEIRIVSAFRDADYQRGLYARAVERDAGQTSSAPPGRSEHQLGTTADVVEAGGAALSVRLADTEAGRWIRRRAGDFGIVVTFSKERHEARGVSWEPWHLRWVGSRVADEGGW
jgi:hypothetical protein